MMMFEQPMPIPHHHGYQPTATTASSARRAQRRQRAAPAVSTCEVGGAYRVSLSGPRGSVLSGISASLYGRQRLHLQGRITSAECEYLVLEETGCFIGRRCLHVLAPGTLVQASPPRDGMVTLKVMGVECWAPFDGLSLMRGRAAGLPSERFVRCVEFPPDADLSQAYVSSPPNGKSEELVVTVPKKRRTERSIEPIAACAAARSRAPGSPPAVPGRAIAREGGPADAASHGATVAPSASSVAQNAAMQERVSSEEELEAVEDMSDASTELQATVEAAPSVARSHSVSSQAALAQLAQTKAQLEQMALDADAAESTLRAGVGRAPSPLRNRLAQLSGSASKLLETKIDAISTVDLESGRQEAKAEKKALTIRADELLTRLHALIEQLDQLKAHGQAASP